MSDEPIPQPLDLDWEKAAVKELSDIMNMLCHGSFVSPDDFCNRVDNLNRAIRTVWGEAQPTARERIIKWRAQLKKFEEDNS